MHGGALAVEFQEALHLKYTMEELAQRGMRVTLRTDEAEERDMQCAPLPVYVM